MKFMCVVLVLFCCFQLAFCSYDAMEENKRMNFDVCDKRCRASAQVMKTFEQGIGYVKCECQAQ